MASFYNINFNGFNFSISAYKNHFGLQNLNEPISLDVTTPVHSWNEGKFQTDSLDAVVNMNMIHISPWDTAIVCYNLHVICYMLYCLLLLLCKWGLENQNTISKKNNVHSPYTLYTIIY
jgi:hypothetical protein